MAAESGGGSGGGGATLKDQLSAMESDRDTHKSRADKAEKDLKTEQDSHGTTKASLAAAETDRDTFKARAEKAEKDLQAEQTAHTALKAKDTTATGKAAEALAKNGIPPAAKDTPQKLATENKDGSGIYAEYKKLRGKARAAFFAKHEKALMAYADEEEKRLKAEGADEFQDDQD
ncbi:MAG TPA: hypothetical protein VGM54_10000 [Chthoniobacter sp.]|jgi:chromosome segregation ATPase